MACASSPVSRSSATMRPPVACRRCAPIAGDIVCDAVVLGLGAWTPKHWAMLGKPMTIDARYPDGATVRKDMWTYWRLLEGEVYVEQPYRTAGDLDPPVLHVELMSTPVIDRSTGRELADHLYVYWKNGAERMDRPGVQGGTIPIKIGPECGHRSVRARQRRVSGRAGVRRLSDFGDGSAHDPLRGLAQELPRAPQWRHRRLHARQRADLRLDCA